MKLTNWHNLCPQSIKMKNIFILLLVFCSCSSPKQVIAPRGSLSGDNALNPTILTYGKLFTALFQQRAAEYRALCFQAYNIARLRLEQALPNTEKLPPAIITDIDETILDNSPYAVHQALLGRDYDQLEWYNWSKLADADTLPGAPSFFKYAASRGVQIFYISNRSESEKMNTLLNLKKYNFPDADTIHLLFRQSTSSKESRRRQVMEHYKVLLLLGDNLGDFSDMFDKKTEDERTKNTNLNSMEFGDRFIVLPNPGYGDWESSFFNYNHFSGAQKDSIIRKTLKNF